MEKDIFYKNQFENFGNFYSLLMKNLMEKEVEKSENRDLYGEVCEFCGKDSCECVEINNAIDLERDNKQFNVD